MNSNNYLHTWLDKEILPDKERLGSSFLTFSANEVNDNMFRNWYESGNLPRSCDSSYSSISNSQDNQEFFGTNNYSRDLIRREASVISGSDDVWRNPFESGLNDSLDTHHETVSHKDSLGDCLNNYFLKTLEHFSSPYNSYNPNPFSSDRDGVDVYSSLAPEHDTPAGPQNHMNLEFRSGNVESNRLVLSGKDVCTFNVDSFRVALEGQEVLNGTYTLPSGESTFKDSLDSILSMDNVYTIRNSDGIDSKYGTEHDYEGGFDHDLIYNGVRDVVSRSGLEDDSEGWDLLMKRLFVSASNAVKPVNDLDPRNYSVTHRSFDDPFYLKNRRAFSSSSINSSVNGYKSVGFNARPPSEYVYGSSDGEGFGGSSVEYSSGNESSGGNSKISTNVGSVSETCTNLPSDPNLGFKKTSLCKYWQRGICANEDCNFAHGKKELRSTIGVWRTTICHHWKSGICRVGKDCRHAHGEEELQPKNIPVNVLKNKLLNSTRKYEYMRKKKTY
ncbi:hypothetical protein BEWA_018140 [Theileria equi strain WA]|uniref:C3H1-type domain-containing protein n=1 Tax=Theileria equi strain WA TaxID=1537102 RepID=L0AVD3_THEEQ|nr:hypothetical protein BEWA_018140 [Theileria equi strain WA]AFZ78971.1 hypothetical protein BEWA_018140 [Theileria equi strain WA]|eukprot:XP_004828637.1 hypothetical protein BEWA_018140 [Theileria equi strain WA]